MQIRISGKNIETGQALQQQVTEKIQKSVTKYFDKAIDADAIFGKRGPFFTTELIINEGVKDGIIIKSEAEADEIHASFELALEKADKQLRRYKRKIKDHHKKPLDAVSA